MTGLHSAARIAHAVGVISTLPDVQRCQLIGSAMYLDTFNDIDYAVLINGTVRDYATMLIGRGWTLGGNYGPAAQRGVVWQSLTLGDVNAVVIGDAAFYERFVRAMEVCKAFNVQCRADRVAICRIVRDGAHAPRPRPCLGCRLLRWVCEKFQ